MYKQRLDKKEKETLNQGLGNARLAFLPFE
jgi:hypothetical protein